MGDNFLLQQIRNFKRGRDLAKAEDEQPRLFERDDLLNTLYPVSPTNGSTLRKGDKLFAVASRDGQHIELVQGHQRVGRTDGDAAKELLTALREPSSIGVVKMQVTEVSSLSGRAQARIINDEKEA